MSSDQGEKGGADITIISHRFVGEVDKIYALLYATINDGFGKESACNAGDLGSIPGSGRSAGEGIGYSLQYSGLENSMDRRAWQAIVHGVTKSWT